MTYQKKKDKIVDIFNFDKDDSFFFQVTKIKSILPHLKSNINLDISDEDITLITKEINCIKEEIAKKEIIKKIELIPFYYDKFMNLEEKERNNSIYAKRIETIMKEYSGQKRLTLKSISSLYNEKYSEYINPMKVSRILRFNLNYHFRNTVFKNPKLSDKNHILMSLLFIKAIIRSIRLKLNIIFIDETGFCLNNTNGKVWRKNKEEILRGPKTNSKNRINLILGINTKEIVYGEYYNNDTISSNEFLGYLEELTTKIDDKTLKRTLFILDNAKIHLTKNIQNFCSKKKLKFLFIVPYKSQYNAIEYCFNLIKSNIYNENITTLKQMQSRIEELINDEKINSDVNKIYKLTLEEYLSFLINKKGQYNFMDMCTSLLNKKRKMRK